MKILKPTKTDKKSEEKDQKCTLTFLCSLSSIPKGAASDCLLQSQGDARDVHQLPVQLKDGQDRAQREPDVAEYGPWQA